jgi:predicted secreted protein
LKVIALNTAVSAALLASWLFLTWWFNFELEDIFELFPMFNR